MNLLRYSTWRLRLRVASKTLLTAAFVFGTGQARGASSAPYPLVAAVGSSGEQSLLIKNAGSAVQGDVRHAGKGQFWVYGLPVVRGARCRLLLTLDGEAGTGPPAATVLGADNKPLAIHTETDGAGNFLVAWTVPDKWPVGGRMAVMLSAKNTPVGVKFVQFTQNLLDNNGDGLPDAVGRMLTEGMPPNARVTVVRPPAQPFTVTLTSQPVTPALDLLTDALFVDRADAATITAWKSRGYAVWTAGSALAGRDFLAANKDQAQTTRDGKPVLDGDRGAVTASPAVFSLDRSLFETALAAGSDGALFVEPEYRANAGYGAAFKQAWQTEYNAPWLDPLSTLDARYKASRLMANMVAARAQAVLKAVQERKPGARRMVTLHSSLFAAQTGLVSPLARIAGLNELTDLIGDVSVDTAGLPTRYAGLRQDMTFARAYLEYSSLLHAARGLNKRVWFQTSPGIDPAAPLSPDARGRYEQTLIAALLCPDVNAYEIALAPQTLTSGLPSDDAVRLQNILAALEDMHNQTGVSGNADKDDDIGVLVGDSAQWQREGPAPSDLDGLFGLALPLLQRGIPVQVLALDRAADPGYLNGFKTLLVSYDYQKPLGARTQQALAEWTRRGGSLIYVGGTDAYNAVSDSWWKQAGLAAPQMDLWKQLGLDVADPTARIAPSEDRSKYAVALKAALPERNFGNRRAYTIDLTPFARQSGSVAVRFSSLAPNDSNEANNPIGAYVTSAELAVNGKVAASFSAGSEIENRFLVYDNDSKFNGRDRLALGSASWTYQFDNLPRNAPVTLTLDMANSFVVEAAASRPDFGHTLLATGAISAPAKAFPRLRIGADYPATLYGNLSIGNSQSTILYALRAGGAPVWMQNVGRGLILNVGVAPGFFSSSERSAGLLRALTRFAHQRAGGTYREPGFLRLRRGHYTIVHTFSESVLVEGRMIDALSPTLNVADDRLLPPNSAALLYDLGVPESEPHVGFVSGRLQAKVETPTATAFFVRGAAGSPGVARLHRGSRRLIGARGMDWSGQPVPVQTQEEGGSVLARYVNHPDGIIVRVGWQ